MTSPTAIFSLEGITKNTTSIGFQDKGNWMYTGGEDKIIRLWDMRFVSLKTVTKTIISFLYRSRQLGVSKQFNHTQPITCISLHPNQVCF